MPQPAPTGRDLHDRLRLLLDAESDEELAVKLGVSLRQVQRLKSGFGANQQRVVDLLVIAGWLTATPHLSKEEASARAEVFRAARRLENHARRSAGETPAQPEE